LVWGLDAGSQAAQPRPPRAGHLCKDCEGYGEEGGEAAFARGRGGGGGGWAGGGDMVYIACERCHGEGYIEGADDDDGDGEGGCPQCHGEGGWYRPREPLKPCEICGGKGSIPQEDEVEVIVRPGEHRWRPRRSHNLVWCEAGHAG